jgi:hypothetical protein
MEVRRSFCLHSRPHDFADPAEDMARAAPTEIPYAKAANDNVPTRARLSARSRALLRRLIAMHRLN